MSAKFSVGVEVKVIAVSNPQHQKQVGKLGRITDVKPSYHGHKNKIPVQLGRDIRWFKPEQLELVKPQPAEIHFQVGDTVYPSAQSPDEFKTWCQNQSVIVEIADDLDGIQQLTLKFTDADGETHKRQAPSTWVYRQGSLFDEANNSPSLSKIGNNDVSRTMPSSSSSRPFNPVDDNGGTAGVDETGIDNPETGQVSAQVDNHFLHNEPAFAYLKSPSAKNWQGAIVPIKFLDNLKVTVSLGADEAIFPLEECHLLDAGEYEQIELLEIILGENIKLVPKGGIEHYLSSFTPSQPDLSYIPPDITSQTGEGDASDAPGVDDKSTLTAGERVRVIQPAGWTALTYARAGQLGTVQRFNSKKKLYVVLLDEPPAPDKRRDVQLSPDRLVKVQSQSPGAESLPPDSTSRESEVVESADPVKNTSQICEVVESADPVKNTSQICEVVEVAIAELWPKEGNSPEAVLLQPRSGLDSSAVERYAAWLEAESEAPPVEVIKIDGRLWLAHGNHRKAAALKVGRTHIKAVVREGNWSEAVTIANTANLSNGLQLDRDELETACKNFLRVYESLPVSAVQSQLEELNRKTGKNFKSFSNGAIAALFGYAESTIRNYRKDLERETALAKFSLESRVIMLPSGDGIARSIWLERLAEPDRMGTVKNINRNGINVLPDNPRLISLGGKSWWFEPEFLQKTDEPAKTYEPVQCKLGDRVRRFPSGELGIVVSVAEPSCNIWDFDQITPFRPLIFWDDGAHRALPAAELDIVGTAELPSVVERLKATRKAIASLEGENSQIDAHHLRLNSQFHQLVRMVTDGEWVTLDWAFELSDIGECDLDAWRAIANEDSTTYTLYGWTFNPERFAAGKPCLKRAVANNGSGITKTTANEHKSVEAEIAAKGRALGLKGSGEQQLPDTGNQFGKSFEDPRTTAVSAMEPPPAQPGFAQSASDARFRIDHALAQIGNPAQAGNFQQWSDEQLERLIRLARMAKQELEAREQKLQQAS